MKMLVGKGGGREQALRETRSASWAEHTAKGLDSKRVHHVVDELGQRQGVWSESVVGNPPVK